MMPVKARVILRRWFHHRTRSEYRELTEDNEKIIPDKIHDWTTVPGLIVEDGEGLLCVEEEEDCHGQVHKPKKDHYVKRSSRCKEPIADMEGVVQRLSRSESYETLETEEESDLADHEHSPKRQRSIRWADDEGRKLVVRHVVQILKPLNVRVVILMLNPAEKTFEFVQCEFHSDERLTVCDLLVQLPFMASMESLKKQRYAALYRGEREMVNIISIQDYDIVEGEILVAVSSTANPKQAIAAAAALLLQRSLLRAVQKAKLSGRALQKLMSSAELAKVLEGAGRPNPANHLYEEDEESREDCRLVLRVLSKELGEHRAEACEQQGSSDDEEEDDQEQAAFPFISVPELNDDEFRLFEQATIDPYSPVARGRMAEIPPNLLLDDGCHFKPPFRSYEEDNIVWDEISSGEEDIGEMDEPEPVVSFSSVNNEEADGEAREHVEEYVGMTAFAEDPDIDDDECIHKRSRSEDQETLLLVSSDESGPGSCAEGYANTSYEDNELLQEMSDDLDPIPKLEDSLDDEDFDDYDDDQDEPPELPEREVCELSHISEVDTLEENDDVTTALTLSQHDSEDSTDVVSNIPVIGSTGVGEGSVNIPQRLAEEVTMQLEEKAVYEASTVCIAVALLLGSMNKISSPRMSSHLKLQPIEVQEAEV